MAALFYNPDADNRQVGLVDGTTGKLRWHAEPLSGDGFADAIADGGDLLYAASGTDPAGVPQERRQPCLAGADA